MRQVIAAVAVAVIVAGTTAPVVAEPVRGVTPETDEGAGAVERRPSSTLDLGLRISRDGFRLGARLFGASGVYGAWLNGQTRPDGFSLDGRVQNPDRAFDFTLNADIDAWARRALDAVRAP